MFIGRWVPLNLDISVIIVSFNTQEILTECLRSVKIALKSLNIEVFVVDNNSHDQTVETVKKNYPWVKVIANIKNVGFSKANNQAIKKAKGRYILILNPDTKVMPDTFARMTEFFRKADKKVAVATCQVVLENGELDKDCRRSFPTPARSLFYFLGLSKIFPKSKIFNQYYLGYLPENMEHEIDSCVGAFMMIRSSAIKKVGLLDEDFFFYGEDLDWCFRFKKAGYKIFYTPVTRIIHYKGVASGMKSETKHLTKATRKSKIKALKESTRAMELFYKKHLIQRYPFIVSWAVIIGIKLLGLIRMFRAYI